MSLPILNEYTDYNIGRCELVNDSLRAQVWQFIVYHVLRLAALEFFVLLLINARVSNTYLDFDIFAGK